MKNDKITIVECADEFDQYAYVFYGAYKDSSPEEAIKDYLAQNGLLEEEEKNIKKDEFGAVSVENICRAYQTTLLQIKTLDKDK